MQICSSNRILINTLVQYVRTIINMVLSLYSSRLVLTILGIDDYGIYSLVAGVVSMLSFLTNSLVGSTQRFLSVNQGKGNINRLKEVFNNSLILHVILGGIICVVLGSLTSVIFNGFLNIPIERVEVAKKLYILVIFMVYTSFIASPYRALLVSHENIVYISIIDILDGILKVILVLLLPYIPIDKLLAYGFIMLGIQIFNLLAFLLYSHTQYEECISRKIRLFSLSYIKELSAFTGWILYSSVCITLRTQGLSILLNKIYGTAINASYGIGSQISGMISFVSTSFNNAISPQLMSAEGGGNRSRMLVMSEMQSKISFLLLATIGIPTIFEMPVILKFWLKNVPDHAVLFSCMFLSMQIIDMLSSGLSSANKAIGNIGLYTFVTYTPKLFILPVSWLILRIYNSLLFVVSIMIIVEALCMLLRIYMFKGVVEFDPKQYCISVIIKSFPPVIASTIVCGFIKLYFTTGLSFLFTYSFSIPIFLILTYTISLNESEKSLVIKIIKKFLRK